MPTLTATRDEGNGRLSNVSAIMSKLHKSWDDRIKWEDLDLLEEYIWGRLCIVIDFDSAACSHSGEIDIAVWADSTAAVGERNYSAVRIEYPQLIDARNGDHRRDDSVLVGDIEQVETVQALAIPTRVSFKTAQEIFGVGPRCLYSINRGFEVLPRVTTRKLQMTVLYSSIEPDQLPHQMIERRAEIMDRITNNKPYVIRDGTLKPNPKQHEPRLWVGLGHKGMRIGIDKSGEHVPKIRDVSYCPIYF